MSLKRRIAIFYVSTICRLFVRKKNINNRSDTRLIENKPLCFVTIAFNNIFLTAFILVLNSRMQT